MPTPQQPPSTTSGHITALAYLDKYKRAVAQAPVNIRTFYAPVDDVAGALAELIDSATHSVVVAMFGFDDPRLADAIRRKLDAPNVFVQLTLDATQAAGTHEAELLKRENYPATSIAIGASEHGRIMHLKMCIVDGRYTVTGSTNWSLAAETLQDNQLTIIDDFTVAAEARSRIDAIHAHIVNKGRSNA